MTEETIYIARIKCDSIERKPNGFYEVTVIDYQKRPTTITVGRDFIEEGCLRVRCCMDTKDVSVLALPNHYNGTCYMPTRTFIIEKDKVDILMPLGYEKTHPKVEPPKNDSQSFSEDSGKDTKPKRSKRGKN